MTTATICICVFVMLLGMPLCARGDDLQFVFTHDGDVISFVLPASPTPAPNFTPGIGFTIDTLNVLVDGVPETDSANFYSCSSACDFLDVYIFGRNGIVGNDLMYEAGPTPLFMGPDSNPTFIPGKYEMKDAPHSTPMAFDSPFQLTIATPEPSSLSMLLAAGPLAFVRKRKRSLA